LYNQLDSSRKVGETLTAGTDTTSVSTAWAIGILCHHPEVQKKLCDEIDAFIRKHGRQPAFSDREELPYFIAFEKECLRFRAPTDLGLPHKVLKDGKDP
jgi:cytochrome P450